MAVAETSVRAREGMAAPAHGTPHEADHVTPRLPHNALGAEIALCREPFLTLHPVVERLEHLARRAPHGALRAGKCAAVERREHPALFRHRHARSFFGERLAQIHRVQPDFLREVEKLRFAELLLAVARAGRLQLERARENAVYGGAVDLGGKVRDIGHAER